eukprot:1879018-Prymnesium_polylepis.1
MGQLLLDATARVKVNVSIVAADTGKKLKAPSKPLTREQVRELSCQTPPLLRPAARLRPMCMCAFGRFAWLPHACEQEAAKEKLNAIWGVTAKTRCYATQASGRLRRATSCGAKTTTCASTSSTAT